MKPARHARVLPRVLVAGLAFTAATAGWGHRAAVLVAVANYLLFFQSTIRQTLRRGTTRARAAGRRASFQAPEARVRACAICGKRDDQRDVDIRVCSCERCGGKPRELCLEHARNH